MTLHGLGLLFSGALVADKELTVFLAAKYSHCHGTALLSVILGENCSLSMFEGRDGQLDNLLKAMEELNGEVEGLKR